MKKYFLLINLITSVSLFSQTPEDALRNSFYPQNGTARNVAIGGAMGSLGGDITATFVNPAGLGMFKTNEFILTPGFMFNHNKNNFRGTDTKSNNTAFCFGTSGWVWGLGTRNKKVSSAVSLAINKEANFNNNIQYSGLNNFSSFSEQFAEEFAKANKAYGLSIDNVLNTNSDLPYGAAPALFTYLIDTITVNGAIQVKGVPEYLLDAGKALLQNYSKQTTGGISTIALGYGHNNNDKFLWGFTFAVPIENYSSKLNFKEFDTSSNTQNGFKQFEYNDNFTTKGIGLNIKLGIIYRPVEKWRIGLAVSSPNFMALTDARTTSLTTQLEKPYWRRDTTITVTSQTFTNNQEGSYRYLQTTPFKAVISASYVINEIADVKKQKGFITADIEYTNHKGSKFSSSEDAPTNVQKNYYSNLTSTIKSSYKGAFNFRLGGELKFNTIMARLGFAHYGNPYKDAPFKASSNLLSGGFGYRNKGLFIDVTYVHNITNDVNFPYRLEDRANTYATLKQQKGNVVATVGIKF